MGEGIDGYSVAYLIHNKIYLVKVHLLEKRTINIEKFYEVLHEAIKDNKILSHDLLEGGMQDVHW